MRGGVSLVTSSPQSTSSRKALSNNYLDSCRRNTSYLKDFHENDVIRSLQWHVRHYMNQSFRNGLEDWGGAKNWHTRSSVSNRFGYQVLVEVSAIVHASKLNIKKLRRRILIVERLIIHAEVFRMLARSMDT